MAVEVWQRTVELLLASSEHWTGGGKWLVRELEALDEARGADYTAQLQEALSQAVAGEVVALAKLAEHALRLVGGPLWSGFRMDALVPDSPASGV